MRKNEQNLIYYIDKHLSADVGVDTFYHYTTVDALVNGITRDNPQKGKEICLRATHCDFVNDPSEISWGAGFIELFLSKCQNEVTEKQRILERYKNLYLISFSQVPNSLPMWNTYANKSTGIAIGFKRIMSLSLSELVLKCWYDPKKILNIIDEDIQSKYKILSFLCTAFLPQMLKHEAYTYEQEVRFIGEFKDSPTKFREKNGYVIPYKEVFFPKEQIESITLGPCAHQEIAESSLRQLLDSRGLGDVKIIKSDIPYRNL